MTFPHSGFERLSLKEAADRAIAIHGQPEHLLDPESRKMQMEEAGVTLSGPELAVVKHVIFDWMQATTKEVARLERAVGEGSVPNRSTAEEELAKLKSRLNFLKHNLAEKLFGETKPTAH